MDEVFINGLGAFFPGESVDNEHMEDHLGLINGQRSRARAVVLRNNRIVARHYALDASGRATHSNAAMAAAAIREAIERSEASYDEVTFLATSTTLGDVLVPGLASSVHAELPIGPIEIASIQSVCVGSLMAIKSAFAMIRAGEHRTAVVSGSEFASRYFGPAFTRRSRANMAPDCRSAQSFSALRSPTARARRSSNERRTPAGYP